MSDNPKPIPIASIQNVVPPNRDRIFFENSESHPFRYTSSRFEMLNAWWLAEASLLAYDEDAYVMPVFSKAGLPAFKSFSGDTTKCYVASNDNFVIVVFRGTRAYKEGLQTNLQGIRDDWMADADTRLVDSQQGGWVHRGFKVGLDEIWKDNNGNQGLESYIGQARNTGGLSRTLWFTGHSLGAARATLAADRYGSVQGLYTFGSPRVGDSDFKEDFHINTYRFVNNDDIVPRLPLVGLYEPVRLPPIGTFRHVDGLKYIDSNGVVDDNPKLAFRLRDRFQGSFGQMFNAIGQIRTGHLNDIPDASLIDHAPLYYTNHIWNNYLKEIQTG
jgi:triacylglycerol lipase